MITFQSPQTVQPRNGRRAVERACHAIPSTRAEMEASSGAMTEALVDVRGCDFSGLDLRKKVMSGVILEEADFSRANLSGVQMSRADARGAKLVDTNFTDVNGYGTLFDGADLRGANFENSMLSNASFGKFQGKWAELGGAHFEGALLSSSDIGRICENPTLDEDTRKYELGCRGAR
ncbi:uncharacterized protein HaLaN_08322 [Haematococcus lacustris]|uniref:Pentapeptide repeat-containing protein n=1 Tax=Haematococcus lacustris TaxID=44745 RepID=A0A699YQI4_HAELA|nr:uncharacterized protein HaLaN_08322 [Haematococcus lacustris]